MPRARRKPRTLPEPADNRPQISFPVTLTCINAPDWTRGHLAMRTSGVTVGNEDGTVLGAIEPDAFTGLPVFSINGHVYTVNAEQLWQAFLAAHAAAVSATGGKYAQLQ